MKSLTGSALLIVLFITAISMIATTASWYSMLLLHDVSHARQQVFQYKQAAQALLLYATLKAKKKFALLCKATEPMLLYKGEWPCRKGIRYTGLAIGRIRPLGGIIVSVTLYNDCKKVFELSSILKYTTDTNTITVLQWGMYESSN